MLGENDLKLSYYREIGVLDESHNVAIVQHTETLKTYLKKTLTIYCKDVYYQIKEHPIDGIPRIYEIFETDGDLVVIEEYITGMTLQEMLDKGCGISERDKVLYLGRLCDILAELHSLNPPIIHRDIKPSNVMLTDDGRIVLIDLNGAKYENTSQKQDTQLIGTQGYAAPEQYGFGPSRTQTDIYSLGVLISVLVNDVPEEQRRFGHIIKKCTEVDINNRYDNVLQVKKALNRAGRGRKRRRILWAAIVSVIAAAVVVLAVRLRDADEIPVQDLGLQPSADEAVTLSDDGISLPAKTEAQQETVSKTDMAVIPETDKNLEIAENAETSGITETVETVETDEPPEASENSVPSLENAMDGNESVSPVGVYVGNDDEILVIAESGLAYYYCYSVEYTELECPWEADDSTLSIMFSKMHCNVTADISKGCDELILKAESRNWNSEVFDRISPDADMYIKQPPSASKNVTVSEDGTMFFSMKDLYFTVPKQLLDYSGGNPDSFTFVDVVVDEDFCAGVLFAFMENINIWELTDGYLSYAERFAGSFMTNLQTGYPHTVTVGDITSYCVNVSGLLNENFVGLENDIYSGQVYIVPDENSGGAIFVMMIQTIGKKQDDQDIFDGIINSASKNMPGIS